MNHQLIPTDESSGSNSGKAAPAEPRLAVLNGFHQAFVTACSASLGISLAYLRFVVFDDDSGRWTRMGFLCAAAGATGVCVMLWALYRGLSPENDDPVRFRRSRNILSVGVGFLLLSSIAFAGGYFFGAECPRFPRAPLSGGFWFEPLNCR